ncbi:unnamed protein product [Coffea canephora]|uniref:RING-type E3 ubiquitin transferase n=1 Tax=Coffea canephora TaxID=49390 RepID=A0A068V1A5_COFCA|nr:unnamed protein product [Coffea canephora]
MDLDNQQQGLLLLQNGHSSSTSSSNNNTRAPTNIATTFSRLTSATLNHHRIFFNDYDDDDEEEEREEHEDDRGRGPSLPVGQECPFSRPFVILDLIWNLGFVLVAAFVLLTTVTERPTTPLRLWIGGYALQCLLHVGFVWLHSQSSHFYIHHFHAFHPFSLLCRRGFVKRLESINTVISSVWWVFGFYWIYMGGKALLQDSPRLYWLSVVFLAFDVFFMIFCIAMAFIFFVLLACCFPILARVAHAMTVGEGASENDIRTLPKYRYCLLNAAGTINSCRKREEAALLAHLGSGNIPELALSLEDSECCICLHGYEDGVEVCTLPCNHHFHYRCIRRWLRINATCPLCKFNILQGEMLV